MGEKHERHDIVRFVNVSIRPLIVGATCLDVVVVLVICDFLLPLAQNNNAPKLSVFYWYGRETNIWVIWPSATFGMRG